MKKNTQSMTYCHAFKSDILLSVIYKGIFMKKISIYIFAILSVFFLTLCTEETDEDYTHTEERPKEAYIDSPTNTYKKHVETLNIANTIQNSGSYLGSRVDARASSKNAVKQSNKRTETQDKAIEALTK